MASASSFGKAVCDLISKDFGVAGDPFDMYLNVRVGVVDFKDVLSEHKGARLCLIWGAFEYPLDRSSAV